MIPVTVAGNFGTTACDVPYALWAVNQVSTLAMHRCCVMQERQTIAVETYS